MNHIMGRTDGRTDTITMSSASARQGTTKKDDRKTPQESLVTCYDGYGKQTICYFWPGSFSDFFLKIFLKDPTSCFFDPVEG